MILALTADFVAYIQVTGSDMLHLIFVRYIMTWNDMEECIAATAQ